MGHTHQEIRVEAPPDHVFEFACMVDRRREWNSYQELFHVTAPMSVVGTSYEAVLDLAGQSTSYRGAVTEVEPARLIHVHEIADHGTMDWFYRFAPADGGTLFTLDVNYEKTGTFAGIVDIIYHGALERATRHIVENFATLARTKVAQPA